MAGHIKDSTSVHWNTPLWLAEAAQMALGGVIELDPCSNEHSIVPAQTKIRLPQNGLEVAWSNYRTIYVNPPYGRDKASGTSIYDWIEKAVVASTRIAGSTVLMIIPATVDTKHWQELVFPHAKKICFLKGRVKFDLNGKSKLASTVPTAAVLFANSSRPEAQQSFVVAFNHLGKVY
jgi:hypothetical protein